MTRETVVTAIDAVQQLAAHAEQQDRHIAILAQGTAKQAEMIRRLREQLSKAQADLVDANYHIGVVREQGRKTRSKMRALKDANKKVARDLHELRTITGKYEQSFDLMDAAVADAQQEARAAYDRSRLQGAEIATLKRHLQEAIMSRDVPAIHLVVRDNPHNVQFVQQAYPFQHDLLGTGIQRHLTTLKISQLEFSVQVPDQDIAAGGQVHEMIAEQVTRRLNATTKQGIEAALKQRRGE